MAPEQRKQVLLAILAILMAVAAVAFLVSPASKYLSVDRFVAERLFRRVAEKHPKLVHAFLQRPLVG